jgi:hypothetical protein
VLSYAIIADYFPQELAARANGALNLVHFLWAFVVQYGVGAIISRWAPQDGHYPAAAYQFAFGLSLALQSAALAWSAVPWIRMFGSRFYRSIEVPDDIRADFTVIPMEAAILEPCRRVEW